MDFAQNPISEVKPQYIIYFHLALSFSVQLLFLKEKVKNTLAEEVFNMLF